MSPPINQEFSHKREPSQIKRAKEPSGIPNELFYGSAFEPTGRIRLRDRSPVDGAHPFTDCMVAPDFGANPTWGEIYTHTANAFTPGPYLAMRLP
jgi:hypothetical protein